jgi:hypothetical protein
MRQGKAFFFEKKKQKAFVCAVADLAGKVRVSTNKSFLVLFLEKGLLACYESWSRPAGITLHSISKQTKFFGSFLQKRTASLPSPGRPHDSSA